MNPVLSSSKFALGKLNHLVHIQEPQLVKLAALSRPTRYKHWYAVSPYPLDHLSLEQRVAFAFVLNSISFSYWGAPNWNLRYRGRQYNGAKAMMVALGKAIEHGTPILNPYFLKDIDSTVLRTILGGKREIPLLSERVSCLRELGGVICSKYSGNFCNFFGNQANALELVVKITKEFRLFQDKSKFSGRIVYFNKRAQLLVADLHQLLPEKIANVDQLTACADYKLPQVLRKYGVLQYNQNLAQQICLGKEIIAGSEEEVAIRAATIVAVDRLTQIIQQKYPNINANQVNDWLWTKSQRKSKDLKPYHKTRTIRY